MKSRGFTLIELLIALAIVAILAAIALPSYSRYGYRARRIDGQQWLSAIAAAQERYYTNFNAYTTSLTGSGTAGLNFSSASSDSGYYTATLAQGPSGDLQSYTLTATPTGAQTGDVCGNLILQSNGVKSFSGSETNGKCWP